MATTTLKQGVPIFVSSTYEDLILYREEAQRVIVRMEQIVKGMEYFGSNPKKPLDVCLENVRNSKIFIGIIGTRYGSIEEKSRKSFTQLEYEEAVKNEIPTLIYIINENQPIPWKFVDTGEKAELLNRFKSILSDRHVVSYFTTPEDLGKKITADLLNVLDSLDQIEINNEAKTKIMRESEEDFREIYEKFKTRPAKYKAQEGVLTIKINQNKSFGLLRPDFADSFGLTYGDAVSISVFVSDENDTFKKTEQTFLFGEKKMGDWIEQIAPETIATVKVRLDYALIPVIQSYDNGSILMNEGHKALILLDVLS